MVPSLSSAGVHARCSRIHSTRILSLYLSDSMTLWKKIYFGLALAGAVFLAISLF
jgi:hypothetical protein